MSSDPQATPSSNDVSGTDAPASPESGLSTEDQARKQRPREIGGPKGPEPTRYGDWEKGGRCIDF